MKKLFQVWCSDLALIEAEDLHEAYAKMRDHFEHMMEPAVVKDPEAITTGFIEIEPYK